MNRNRKPKRIHEIERRRVGIRRCPYCGNEVRETAFKHHIHELHPERRGSL